MNPAPLGVPLEELPLDTDPEFANLEAKRAKLMRNPEKNRNAIADLDDALNDRAEELAKEKIHGDREFLDKEPAGVPVKYIPLDDDPEFKKMETERQKAEG
ncbi:calpain-like cysteine peptidase [Angomonas deanei]|uniref:DUF7623 domain-containing protein n=1 Tax=Angomonas deanei TaxID=59799 RepID=A0A7G2C6F0_9TRYP|nr:calpain-like cysteine peptidase [Angomonas deanei]CAD2215398.1 hypothetical protein, conserved [Angomonas deanei]|eukprot:EPY16212.1 calpain-like cysteine peptidase [Angomonas deanei]